MKEESNFRFRAGLFGRLVLQKKVYEKSKATYTWCYWEDAKVEDLEDYYKEYQIEQNYVEVYQRKEKV